MSSGHPARDSIYFSLSNTVFSLPRSSLYFPCTQNNAAVVAIVDSKPYLKSTDQPWEWKWKSENEEVASLPLNLLTREGFNDFDPFLPIRVDKLSEREAEAMLDYLRQCNFLCRKESFTENGRAELKFMSAYNAGDLVDLCSSR